MRAPVIKGWCPGALRPMISGDGLVVRVRPRGGRLDPVQAAGIAALTRAHCNGLIELTARANLQLRGITEASYPTLIEGLAALDLIDATPECEARRNIVVTPFWTSGDGVQELAASLSRALAAADIPSLPGKFGFAIDCGPVPVLHGVSADIRLERDAGGGFICRADGAAAGAGVTADTVADVALALVRWFLTTGGANEGRGRMAAHLARGVPLPIAFAEVQAQSAAAAIPAPGTVASGLLVGFEFGQIQAETLTALAKLGAFRVTPWRMLLIEGVTSVPDLPGLITRPEDPMLRVVACTGAPGCLQAAQPTRALARALVSHLPPGTFLHVSGCAKGCAHPAPASFTLTAHSDGFDLIRDGTAKDEPILRNLAPEQLRPETLIEAI